MHVLTKALVVIAAILSVALSALVIAYAVNTDRIAADYANERGMRIATDAAASSQAADFNTQKVRTAAMIEQLNREDANKAARIASLESEAAVLRSEKSKAETERQNISNKIQELGETASVQAKIIGNYREEVTNLRQNELGYRTRQAELDDRINDLESQREVLQQNYQALQEQIAEAKRTQEMAMTGKGSGTTGPIIATADIRGRVDSVQRDPTNKKVLAKINVGTNDRVVKNMQFYITRGESFIGDLVVTEPDLRWSIGEVTLQASGQEIKEGDLIRTRLQ